MKNITLVLRLPGSLESWRKVVVINQPSVGDFIYDSGILMQVWRIQHNLSDGLIEAGVRSEPIKGNDHWELGHERGWKLVEPGE